MKPFGQHITVVIDGHDDREHEAYICDATFHDVEAGENLVNPPEIPWQVFAAAPELLAACKLADDVLTEPGIMDVDEWKALSKRAVRFLKQAIAKAEGQS